MDDKLFLGPDDHDRSSNTSGFIEKFIELLRETEYPGLIPEAEDLKWMESVSGLEPIISCLKLITSENYLHSELPFISNDPSLLELTEDEVQEELKLFDNDKMFIVEATNMDGLSSEESISCAEWKSSFSEVYHNSSSLISRHVDSGICNYIGVEGAMFLSFAKLRSANSNLNTIFSSFFKNLSTLVSFNFPLTQFDIFQDSERKFDHALSTNILYLKGLFTKKNIIDLGLPYAIDLLDRSVNLEENASLSKKVIIKRCWEELRLLLTEKDIRSEWSHDLLEPLLSKSRLIKSYKSQPTIEMKKSVIDLMVASNCSYLEALVRLCSIIDSRNELIKTRLTVLKEYLCYYRLLNYIIKSMVDKVDNAYKSKCTAEVTLKRHSQDERSNFYSEVSTGNQRSDPEVMQSRSYIINFCKELFKKLENMNTDLNQALKSSCVYNSLEYYDLIESIEVCSAVYNGQISSSFDFSGVSE